MPTALKIVSIDKLEPAVNYFTFGGSFFIPAFMIDYFNEPYTMTRKRQLYKRILQAKSQFVF